MDVLSASLSDDKIAWYENTDGAGTFVEHEISTNAGGAFSVYSADLDGDGDMDVLSALVYDGKIAWYENTVRAGGSGCGNSTGAGGTLTASGDPSLSNDTLVLEADGLVAGQPCLFFSGANRVNGGAGITFGDGLRCAGYEAVRIQVTTADPSGSVDTSVEVSTNGQAYGHTIESGETVNYQCWYRDQVAVSPCGNSFNTTNGYAILWGS
jgi:hypothetical protein